MTPRGAPAAASPARPEVAEDASFSLRIVTLAPEDAAGLLARRRPQARDHQAAIRAYAEAMREGSWILNGVPLILSRNGVLLDGVQRLRACQEAGRPLVTFLAERVPDDVLHTVDQHRRRSFAGVLEARGIARAAALHAALVKLLHYEDGVLGRAHPPAPSWARLDRILAANPDLPAIATARDRLQLCLPAPLRIPLVFMGRRADPDALGRLLRAVTNPDEWPAEEPGVLLRHEIDRGREDAAQRVSAVRLFALAVIAFNATRAGEQLRRLAWVERRTNGRAGDPFPRLDGYAGLSEAAAPAPAPLPLDSGRIAEGLTWRIETIDAARAEAYLRHNLSNRRTVRAHVDGIARDIAAGRWMLNAQPICFSRDGRLMNGQHRLAAVVAARGTIEVAVVRGLPEEAQPTYDIQAKRGVEFGQPLEGFGDTALLAAMANLLWRHEERPAGTRKAKATAAELRSIIERHPRLMELRGFARRMVDFGRASVIGYAAYVIEREDPAQGRAFLRALETGARLPENHPVLALRRSLQRLRRAKAGPDEQLEALLQGWGRCRPLRLGD